jgi:hypothetical protein
MKHLKSFSLRNKCFSVTLSIISIFLLQIINQSLMAQDDVLIIGDENFVEGKENGKEYLFGHIRYVTVDNEGNIYISDVRKKSLTKFSPDGIFLTKIGGTGKGPGEYVNNGDIITDGMNYIYMSANYGGNIIKYDLNGKFICDYSIKQLEEFSNFLLGDFELLGEDHFVFHGFRYENLKYPYLFYEVDFIKKTVIPFGDYPEYEKDKQVMKLTNDESAIVEFFQGNMVIDPESRLIHFVKRLHPRELLLYELGNNEFTTLFVDKSLSGGFNIAEMKKSVRNGYARPVPNQSVSVLDSYIVNNTLYREIQDFISRKMFIRGYSTKNGEIVFNEEIEIDIDLLSRPSIYLQFIDANLNAYFSITDPFSHLLRVKLKNGGTINLNKN